jgi:hypothetical protein
MGGLYETFDGAQNWILKQIFQLHSFTKFQLDNSFSFYNVYGGTGMFSLSG